MPFVLKHDTFGANIDLIIFTEELSALVRMLETELLRRLLLQLVLVFLLLRSDYFVRIQVV